MTAPLANPFALGATGVLTTARTDRLSVGAAFRPAASALSAVSGCLVGPAGTMGELTLVSDTLLRVAPFVACIQGTHNTQQGQYVVTNGQQRDLAVPAKDASQYRRALVVTRVADSLEAGVASSATTDGAWVEVIPGALAASNPALPATPANALVLGELSIPSSGSGQPVSLTPYNPRTGLRGGIMPVFSDSSTVAGHGGEPGHYTGQHRDHPTRGLERWTGTAWLPETSYDAPLLMLRRVAAGTVAHSTWVAITWDAQDIDTHDMWTSGWLSTVRRSGYYRLNAGWGYMEAAGRRVIRATRNYTGTQGSGTNLGGGTAPGGVLDSMVRMDSIVYLAEGDTVTVEAFQDSGAAQPTHDIQWSRTYLSMEWLRPAT